MKIFVCVSYSSKVDSSGNMLPEYRATLESVISALEAGGHEVFCGPRHDGWKLNEASPREALELDITNLDDCDVVIALLGEAVSAGLQFELGYALAKHKRTFLALEKGQRFGYMNQGLVDAGKASVVNYESQDQLVAKLKASL